MEYVILIVPGAAVPALLFALFTARKVLKMPEAECTRGIAAIIRKGANAFLKRQYAVVAVFFGCMFLVLGVLALVGFVGPFMPFAFLTGGVFSGLSGFLGMKIATAANARTATAAQHSLNRGLRAAFSAGSVMGLVVVGLGLCDLSVWYFVLKGFYGITETSLTEAAFIATNMITFGMGASSMALFARVGGGIFTKAADVGADLVGKVEANIPEDDHRNPAVIADNVGDNVGDVAGMGADLYESYVGSLLSAMALGVAAGLEYFGALIPLGIAAIGVLFSVIGSFLVRTKEGATQKGLLRALRAGTWFAAGATAAGSALFLWLASPENILVIVPVLIGLAAGVLIGFFTELFTSTSYRPTKKLAASAESGAGPVVINGTALGMLSTLVPVLLIAAAVLGSYFVLGGGNMGMFGVGVAAVGMLSTLGITLSTDAYGPVADNAGGIAQMAGMDEEVRRRTDALDSLGNTTAATGKGFAIGSAMLTALALLSSFYVQVETLASENGIAFTFALEITNPVVLVGVFVGAMLPFLFSALTMSAVGKSAQQVVLEVRRQFASDKGILTGRERPRLRQVRLHLHEVGAETDDPARRHRRALPHRRGTAARRERRDGAAARFLRFGLSARRVHEQQRRRVGQREKIHRGRQLRRQGQRRAQSRRHRRHSGRPVQGHVGALHQHSHQTHLRRGDRVRGGDSGGRAALKKPARSAYGARNSLLSARAEI